MTTRTLHLLRHAKSDWSDPGLADRDRPLADKGRKQVRRLAAYVPSLSVDVVVCSPAARARATLEPLRAALDCPVTIDDAVYEAGVGALIDVVSRLPDEATSALLVGHMPGLALLLQELTGSWTDLPTGALATVESSAGTWRDLAAPAGSADSAPRARLVRVVTPRDLKGA